MNCKATLLGAAFLLLVIHVAIAQNASRGKERGGRPNEKTIEEQVLKCAKEGSHPEEVTKTLDECYEKAVNASESRRKSGSQRMPEVMKCMLMKAELVSLSLCAYVNRTLNSTQGSFRRMHLAKLKTALGDIDDKSNLGKAITRCMRAHADGPTTFHPCVVEKLKEICEIKANVRGGGGAGAGRSGHLRDE